VPQDFNFTRTVVSHGWYALPPFSYDEKTGVLERVLELQDGSIVNCSLNSGRRSVQARLEVKSNESDQTTEIRKQLRTCLRLDEDFTEFHRDVSLHKEFRWLQGTGSGRLLRAPTAFEDLVKMLCTTNCTWALTTVIVTNLVRLLGRRAPNGNSTFPSPSAIASKSETFLRRKIKAGYRAPYLLELSRRVASGDLNVEAWRATSLSTADLLKQLRAIKGIGPYAAENMLKLLGRYDHLGLDSWVRARYYRLHHAGRKVKDTTIQARYNKYGKWRGLLFWLEMTRSWHERG